MLTNIYSYARAKCVPARRIVRRAENIQSLRYSRRLGQGVRYRGAEKKWPSTVQICSKHHDLVSRVKVLQIAFIFMMASVLTGCSTVPNTFAPVDPLPAREFSHQLLNGILHDHVVDGRVEYPSIQSDPRFPQYLAQLDRVDPNSLPTQDDQLAFWINTYNALAIKGIVDHYSPETLWGRYKYFLAREYPVGGRHLTLDSLESRILIAQFREPRIHFVIVCASASCPKLQSRAYQAAELDSQLEAAAKAFIKDPTRNRFDRQQKVAALSKIFEWFEADFAAQAGSLLKYVARYLDDPDLAQELTNTPYRVEFLDYDWRLNGVSPVAVIDARGAK